MKKTLLLASLLLATAAAPAYAETITLNDKDYTVDRIIERQIGPGTTYMRLRLPDYPLNVNIVTVDLNNPYNRIETTVAKESSRGTEGLVTAAARQTTPNHRPMAAANANFWVVGSQPEGNIWSGITRNVSLRNGKMITESNQHRDQWDGGTMRTGIVSVSYDRILNIAPCHSNIRVWSDKFESTEVHQCNKGFWSDEMAMYNSHYGASTKFMPINSNGTYYIEDGLTDCSEVILDFDEGQQWVSGTEMTFVVKEVRTSTDGRGTLGNHDLALCGRGANAATLALLAPGDKVSMRYQWTFNPGTEKEVTPLVENAIGGNAMVMLDGELLDNNYNEAYNSQIYSRCGYGCSADGKMLYIVVIDKSTDPVYGLSKGCGTDIMCQIAKYFGCSNMSNFDAGGSAEMMVDGAIINKTTEGSPRAVANGWMVFNTSPEDDTEVASLAFYDIALEQPILAGGSPRVIAYNKYGSVIDYDYKDVTYSCDEAIGTCEGNIFIAGSVPAKGMLTAHAGDVTVTKEMNVVGASVQMRYPTILIDNFREYPLEVTASTADKTYIYDPSFLQWTVENPEIVTIDSDGVLRGLKNGTTKISGEIGGFVSEATVIVEIADSPLMLTWAPTAWTLKGASGMTDVTMDEDGLVTYSFGKKTTGHVDLTIKDTYLYSLPDAIYADFNSSVPIASITVDVLPQTEARPVSYKIEPAEPFAADTDHHVDLQLGSKVDLDDIASYPIQLRHLRFTFQTRPENKGANSFNFPGAFAEYKHYDAVEEIAVDTPAGVRLAVCPNPAQAGAPVTVKAPGITSVTVYSISGAVVSTADTERADAVQITAPAAGTYVVAASTGCGVASAVMIVK